MKQSTRSLAILVVLLLFVPIVLLQKWIDKGRKQFEPNNDKLSTIGRALPIEFTLGAATGFREAIAGLLWVRTDKFFHEGNYDAIVPMVRLITWLDPHNVDVYQTGAWHLDYNFTDAAQRSDRRYLPLSVALLEEGIDNNPTTTKLYADLAFTHYFRKMCNYPESVKWYTKAQALREEDSRLPITYDPTTKLRGHYVISSVTHLPTPLADPTIVGHGMAHALQAEGDIDGAIAQWKYCIAEHKRLIIESRSTAAQDQSGLAVAGKNLNETLMRKQFRLKDTKPPIDFQLDAHLERTGPMQFKVVGSANVIGATNFKLEGHKVTWGPVDGARIGFRLVDADYKQPTEVPFLLSVKLPHDVTMMQDSVSISKGKFSRAVSMAEDHEGKDPMYPFKAEKYKFTFWFDPADPASSPPNLQDRIGWVGEGMTDKRYLNTSGMVPGALQKPDDVRNVRLLEKVIYLTHEDIMGTGPKTFQ